MDDNNTSNTGSFISKLKERLRKIRLARIKKRTRQNQENKKFIEQKVEEIRIKVTLANNSPKPKVIRKPMPPKKTTLNIQNLQSTKTSPPTHLSPISKKTPHPKKENLQVLTSNPKSPSQQSIKTNTIPPQTTKKTKNPPSKITNPTQEKNSSKLGINLTPKNNPSPKQNPNNYDNLKQEIIINIKNEFLKQLAQLQILESQLYTIEEQNEQELELQKVKKITKEINKIIAEINDIIAEYNIYRKSHALENCIDLNDNVLIDKIITYKNLTESHPLNQSLVKDYKLLNEYQYLYNKLDEIKNLTENIQNNNKNKITNFTKRDNNYHNIKAQTKASYKVLQKCNQEITKQNQYLKDLMTKIDIIDKHEYTIYKSNILSTIIKESAKFICTLLISPITGLVPSICINTLATNNLLKNISHNIINQKITQIEYTAQNYHQEIANKMNDLTYTSALINDTLTTITELKNTFLDQYDVRIPDYQNTLKQINTIQDQILTNKYIIHNIQKNLQNSQQKNTEKIRKLEKLNKTA